MVKRTYFSLNPWKLKKKKKEGEKKRYEQGGLTENITNMEKFLSSPCMVVEIRAAHLPTSIITNFIHECGTKSDHKETKNSRC